MDRTQILIREAIGRILEFERTHDNALKIQDRFIRTDEHFLDAIARNISESIQKETKMEHKMTNENFIRLMREAMQSPPTKTEPPKPKMTKENFILLMQNDIRNEYKHMHFYLHSAVMVGGIHRKEYSEFFLEEAASEMKHVEEFGRKIIGLGAIPETLPSGFPTHLKCPIEILRYILKMETEVVCIYADRLKQAADLGGPDGAVMEAFYENQILDSRNTAEDVAKMLEEVTPKVEPIPFRVDPYNLPTYEPKPNFPPDLPEWGQNERYRVTCKDDSNYEGIEDSDFLNELRKLD